MPFGWRRERPGPVHLELPEDVAGEQVDQEVLLVPPHAIAILVAHPAALDRAADMILRAERPLIVLGAAASRRRSTSGLANFVRRTRIPFFTTRRARSGGPRQCSVDNADTLNEAARL
jgi:acetolactate synthase-1/2/3 large subunit